VLRVGLATLFLLGGGCGNDGAVHIAIALPDDALSPLTEDLTRLELVAEADGKPAESVTRDVPPNARGQATIGFGDLAIGDGVRLSLFGFGASGRLVGYGRASVPVDFEAGNAVDISIALRRPFAYVAGGSSLLACALSIGMLLALTRRRVGLGEE